MPSFILESDEYVAIRFTIPPSQRPKVHYFVEASRPISVYIVDRGDLSQFRTEGNEYFEYYIGNSNRISHEKKESLSEGTYYLLIFSRLDENIAVYYELD